MSACLFCKIIAGDIPAHFAYQDEEVVAIYDINPQAPLHILLIPRRHVERVADITEADRLMVGGLIFRAKKLADEKKVADAGFRLVLNSGAQAGQSVFHIHLHLLGGRAMSWPPG